MSGVGFIEGLILLVIFVFSLALALRHVKRAFGGGDACGSGCGGCPSAGKKPGCPPLGSGSDDGRTTTRVELRRDDGMDG